MRSSSITAPGGTPREPEPQPGLSENAAKPPAPRREAHPTSTPTRPGPRFGSSSSDSTPGPQFGGVVATAVGSALRTAVSRVGDVVAPRAPPQSSESLFEHISQSPFVASGPSRSREALELRGAARMPSSDVGLPSSQTNLTARRHATIGGKPSSSGFNHADLASPVRYSADLALRGWFTQDAGAAWTDGDGTEQRSRSARPLRSDFIDWVCRYGTTYRSCHRSGRMGRRRASRSRGGPQSRSGRADRRSSGAHFGDAIRRSKDPNETGAQRGCHG